MDRFSRIERLLGAQAVSVLRGSRVAVVGLGAVGSFAVEGLARSGIGFLRLADFDRVELSNINRQLFALQSTVGMPKAVVAVERVRR
jgi:tRNA A37 threonylcarbamoyladenosine dehydratase